jgi:hypothetical protein
MTLSACLLDLTRSFALKTWTKTVVLQFLHLVRATVFFVLLRHGVDAIDEEFTSASQ